MADTIRVTSVSGGKDSSATAILSAEDHPQEFCRYVFADTGNEHDLTYEYVYGYMQNVMGFKIDTVKADFTEKIKKKKIYIEEHWEEKGVDPTMVSDALAIMEPTGVPFLDLCLWKNRFPSRRAQFCTQELKRYPMDAYMFELMELGYKLESWRGIRKDESQARRHAVEREEAAEGWTIVHPIVDWTAQETVDFVINQGFELNPLYAQGMNRVGCMPCINCSKPELQEIAKRFPEHIDKIREWERLVALAAKRGFATFFAGPAIRRDSPMDGYVLKPKTAKDGTILPPYVEGDKLVYARMNIDQKVEWSKTTFGGRQYDLMGDAEAPDQCTSSYGLCE